MLTVVLLLVSFNWHLCVNCSLVSLLLYSVKKFHNWKPLALLLINFLNQVSSDYCVLSVEYSYHFTVISAFVQPFILKKSRVPCCLEESGEHSSLSDRLWAHAW